MERPIILKAHEVRGILDGRQTQLRRIIKPQPEHALRFQGFVVDSTDPKNVGKALFLDQYPLCTKTQHIRCPFGQVGDRLWCRETWFSYEHFEGVGHDAYYRADQKSDNERLLKYIKGKWKPSTHMPRWASRILLEIVSVRVERLQDISREDSLAHGATSRPNCTGYSSRNEGWSIDWTRVGELSRFGSGHAHGRKLPLTEHDICTTTPEFAFASKWLDDYGIPSWNANPWVWVVEFKRVEA